MAAVLWATVICGVVAAGSLLDRVIEVDSGGMDRASVRQTSGTVGVPGDPRLESSGLALDGGEIGLELWQAASNQGIGEDGDDERSAEEDGGEFDHGEVSLDRLVQERPEDRRCALRALYTVL